MHITPPCRAVLNLAILVGIVDNIVANHSMPAINARYGVLIVEEVIFWIDKFIEGLDIYLAVVLEL